MVAVLLIPCCLAQQNLSFQYGMSGMAAPGSQVANDRDAINEKFGESASFALMVPEGNSAAEKALSEEVKALPQVASVISYAETVGSSIPDQYVPPDQLKELNSGGYTRLVITARIPPESPETFAFVKTLRQTAQKYYPDSALLAGECANVYDMKETITADSVKVNAIAIGAIALILLVNFHSITLPFLPAADH